MSKDIQDIEMGLEEKLKDLLKTWGLPECQHDTK